MRTLTRALALVLGLWCLLGPAALAAPQTGFMSLPRSCQGYSAAYQIDQASRGFSVIKVSILPGFATDPSDLARAIQDGVSTVILNTGSYSYQEIQHDFETPGGIAGYSYADLMSRYPGVTFILEVGNEPDNQGYDPWSARWWALAAYKELALNQLGHIDQAWRVKYPRLQWAINTPTKFDQTQIFVQWEPGDDLGAGGVRDYYDFVSDHIYGWYQLGDGGGADWMRIHQFLLADPYTRQILITELGIDDPGTSYQVKAQRYHDFLLTQPAKVTAATAFVFCADGWDHYNIGRDPVAVARYAGR